MSSLGRLLLSLAVLAAVAGAACGDPPDKEMQQAQGAIDAARAAGADQYAPEEFAAAQDALKRSREAVAQRDYRQALNTALDARERAQAAAKESANRKTSARADATKALADADAALHESRVKLQAAEVARAPARALISGRRAIHNSESGVQEARTAFEKEDYRRAIDTARSVSARLGSAKHDLDVATAAGRRRRHQTSSQAVSGEIRHVFAGAAPEAVGAAAQRRPANEGSPSRLAGSSPAVRDETS